MTDSGIDRLSLFHEVMRARQRIYRLARPTPLENIPFEGVGDGAFFLKREDLSPVHSYKWRGAGNKMTVLGEAGRAQGVVAASAGNHAQGVALASRRFDCRAKLFMPRSTPRMKIRAVEQLGGEAVDIVIAGDTYSDVAALALEHAEATGATFIHPYDDLQVMAGQGTLGDEVVMAGVEPTTAFLQIGGGGMAAATACVLKTAWPGIRIVGVEGAGQASMARAVEAGGPAPLDEVDVFCDGTAVRSAGKLTWRLCADLIDEFMTVDNNEVCAAIQFLWESGRMISEPSGALGVAGAMKRRDGLRGERVLCVLSGANMDFAQLGWIARHAGVGLAERRYFEFEIDERNGSLLDLLEAVADEANIIDFQYGKVDAGRAWPVIGFEAGPMHLQVIDQRLRDVGVPHKDVTSREDVEFRIIHYRSRLFRNPWFAIIEFPERAGALYEFLRRVGDMANICYFNYATTGEQVGHALMGFEFESPETREKFRRSLETEGPAHRELSPEVVRAIL